MQVAQASPADSQSVLTGVPIISPTVPQTQMCSASMAMVTPSPPLRGSTTAASMDNGPNMLLRQLMSNVSVRSANSHQASPNDSVSLTTTYNGHKYQVRKINNTIYRISQQDQIAGYTGAVVDSGANGGLAGFDTRILSIIPHTHVDITGVRGDVMEWLPLVQWASVVETIDEGKIILIMSQYAHRPDSKTIHSKSQLEYFGSVVYDSAKAAGGHQMVVTHEGYAIPLHVQQIILYGYPPGY